MGVAARRVRDLLDSLLRLPVFERVPPDADTALIAYEAFVAFGKGTGHPAGLDFGDVFAYALARSARSIPLWSGTLRDPAWRTTPARAVAPHPGPLAAPANTWSRSSGCGRRERSSTWAPVCSGRITSV
jgi:hypothetical protein